MASIRIKSLNLLHTFEELRICSIMKDLNYVYSSLYLNCLNHLVYLSSNDRFCKGLPSDHT